jgi:hypothetical protein
MQMFEIDSPLSDEAEIIWRYDPALFPHVRKATTIMAGRKRAVTLNDRDGRVLIGYAVLKSDAVSLEMGRYYRRFFYIMPYDFERQDRLRPPCEAVLRLFQRAENRIQPSDAIRHLHLNNARKLQQS